jgi:hypothetical protein
MFLTPIGEKQCHCYNFVLAERDCCCEDTNEAHSGFITNQHMVKCQVMIELESLNAERNFITNAKQK